MTDLNFREGAFLGARLKIERAKQHIDEAERWVGRIYEINKDVLGLELNPDAEQYVFRHHFGIPDSSLGVIIGDAVHNLRVALDFVAAEVLAAAGQDPETAAFPIDETRHSLVTQRRYRDIERVAPDVARIIAELVGDNGIMLVALNQLDRADKHRLLLLSKLVSKIDAVCIDDENDPSSFQAGCFLVLPGPTPVTPGSPADLHNNKNNKPTFTISFLEVESIKDKPVIPTLRQFAQLVEGIVETLATHCIAGKP